MSADPAKALPETGAGSALPPTISEKWDTPIAIGLVALTLVRAVFASQIGLTDDEAYYRLWSLVPSAGYYDHAPMVAWFIAGGRSLLGDTELGVRLLAITSSIAGAFALWRTAALLFGPDVGRASVIIAAAMPLLGAGAIVVTPDTPSTLFTILALWGLAELHASRNAWWWLAIGLFAGLGLASKYTNLFLGVSILIWLVAVPDNRRHFMSWQLWAGGFIALAVFLPVLHWNATHEWVSFAKQFGRVGASKGLTLKYLSEMIGAMALLASPVIAVFAAMGAVVSIREARASRSSAHVLLIATIAPMLLYFLQHSLHDRVQANWPAPLYPSLAMAAALGAFAGRDALAAWRWVAMAAAVGFAITGLIYAHATRPLVLIPGKREVTHQLHGWPDFASEVDRMRREKGAGWIATSSYSTTAQLAFRLDRGVPVLQLDERIRYGFLPPPPETVNAQRALYVELERRARPEDLARRYSRVEPVGAIERRIDGFPLARYAVFVVEGPVGDLF
ncbi:MAG: glycosyltransferase family 39 protein [Hyphomicrobium sp.]|nr:glycosyltransferase family 39 protein [Hyphomicrobium sp.]